MRPKPQKPEQGLKGLREQRPVRDIALDLLARREHSRRELRNKLLLRKCDADEIEELLSRLAIEGLQSDERYTEAYTHSRKSRGFGPLRIQAELGQRGIDKGLAQQYLEASAGEWLEIAQMQIEKKFGTLEFDNYQARMKPARFLQNRGFPSEIIRSILNSFE